METASPLSISPASPVENLVYALGGPAHVARQIGVTCAGVCMWFRKGRIPQKHHLAVWRMAQAKGVAWRPPGFEDLTLAPAEATTHAASNDAHKTAA